jgi:hypothetical protein
MEGVAIFAVFSKLLFRINGLELPHFAQKSDLKCGRSVAIATLVGQIPTSFLKYLVL